jgi:hypothetical protein
MAAVAHGAVMMNQGGESSAIADRELLIDVMQVDLDCSLGDVEGPGDFFVRQPEPPVNRPSNPLLIAVPVARN